MRIILTIGGLVFGGAERVMSNIANYLAKQDNEVMIITVHNREPAYRLDNRITLVNGLDWNGKLSFIKVCTEYRSRVREFKPDVILSFLTQINEFVLFATQGMKIPVVVSERNDPAHSATTKIRKFIRRMLYPMASGIVFQTDEAMHYFDNVNLRRKQVIPNPIYIEEELLSVSFRRKKEIVTAGRLFGAKNQKMLIEVFSKISDDYPEYNLTIYGEGELREELESQVCENKLQGRVFLPGSTKELHINMKKADIFVLCSDFEGMPNVLMEAMACGMACISTDCPCGGPRYLIDDGVNGVLIPVGGAAELEQALRKLIDNPDKKERMAAAAEKIYDKLKPEIVCGKWEQYLVDICKTK